MNINSSIASRLEAALFAAFLSILVWAPLPFASNRIWAEGLLVALVALVLAAWLVLFLLGHVRMNAQVWRYARIPVALLGLVQVWVLLQIVYLPSPVVELLSPQAFYWHVKDGWLSLSLDREYTKYHLLKGCAYMAGFFLALALVNSHQRLKL
ncbi:MAG: hypothetical protein AAGB19_03480, partial [Cyanobacteria bacterium P01_F01_bin.3]